LDYLFNTPGAIGSFGFDMKVFDIYKKNGKWVVEVGYKRNVDLGKNYSVQLCVVDAENGRLSLPSPMNDSEQGRIYRAISFPREPKDGRF